MNDDLVTLLHERLNRETAQAPAAPPLGDVIVRCERDFTRHRRRIAAASLVAVAGVGALVASLPLGASDQSTNGMANDVAKPRLDVAPERLVLVVPPTRFPATVAAILGRSEVTPRLAHVPSPVEDTDQVKGARFLIDGMLVTVTIFSGDAATDAAQQAGDGTSGYEFSPSDGVLARGASIQRDGYVIVALAYNTATNPNPPARARALAADPILSEDQLLQVVTSDMWFESTRSSP